MSAQRWSPGNIALGALVAALCAVLAVSVSDLAIAQWLFVHSTYYLLLVTVLCWTGTYLYAARNVTRQQVVEWVRQNWRGLVIAVAVTTVAELAIEPALRVLSDEANLVGISKNLFATKTATFTVSGKNYYESYWDIDVVIDRRPTLFPFLVSLVHTVCGYSFRNVFVFNLLLLPPFLIVSYRLAKQYGGETFGILTSLLVVAHPIALISVRSGGFDFFATFFALLIVKSLSDYCRQRRPERLAIVWMNLCLFAEIRYESALFIPPVVVLLFGLKLVDWSTLRPQAFTYALTPVFLMPRIWQSLLRGNIPEQDPRTVTFSVENFFNNLHEYFLPLLEPTRAHPAHSGILIALGICGCLLWLRWVAERLRARAWRTPQFEFAIFVAAWMLVQVVVVFTYFWGRAQYPTAARLVMVVDAFFSFAAAWILAWSLQRWSRFVPVLLAVAVVLIELPVASQHRMMNRLTQTRESAATWRFFERLEDKRILIVTDRPNHFVIMNFGAMSFDAAKRDPYLFTALERGLFQDVYVIQQIRLSTNEPLPGFEIWPEQQLHTELEFQNDADVLVRISRVAHSSAATRIGDRASNE